MNLHHSCLLSLVFTGKNTELEWPVIWHRVGQGQVLNFRPIYPDIWEKDTEKQRFKFQLLVQAGSFSENQTCATSVFKKAPAADQHYNDMSQDQMYLSEYTPDSTSLQAQLQTTNSTRAFIGVQDTKMLSSNVPSQRWSWIFTTASIWDTQENLTGK